MLNCANSLLSINLIFPLAILMVSLEPSSHQQKFSLFIRVMSFRTMISSIVESTNTLMFGFGPGSSTERLDLTEVVSTQIGDIDGLVDINKVSLAQYAN